MDGNVRASGEVRWRLTISSRMISDLTLVTNGANSELSAMHAQEQEYQNETVLCCYQSIYMVGECHEFVLGPIGGALHWLASLPP